MKPLAELKLTLSEFAERCRAARWFGALFWQRQIHDITSDLAAEQAVAAREAYSAEQEDREAMSEQDAAIADLRAALQDGIDSSDEPRIHAAINRVRLARVHAERSADRDRTISELFQQTA